MAAYRSGESIAGDAVHGLHGLALHVRMAWPGAFGDRPGKAKLQKKPLAAVEPKLRHVKVMSKTTIITR